MMIDDTSWKSNAAHALDFILHLLELEITDIDQIHICLLLLDRVFVGTVSEFCVKHAECPVITIKRSAEESPQDPADD